MDEKKFGESVGSYVKAHMIELVVILACVVYVLSGIATIGETGESISKIIARGGLAFMFGILINELLGKKGLINGEQDERFINTLEGFAKTVSIAINGIDKLGEYCSEITQAKKEKIMTEILNRAGLKYCDYIGGKYNSAEMDRHEKLAIKRVQRVKVKELTKYDLLGEQGVQGYMRYSEDYFDGRTKRIYANTGRIKDVVSKILFAVLFGYFGFQMLEDINWLDILWTVIQVVFFLTAGVMKYVTNYDFIIDEYRSRILTKKNMLEEFNKRYNLNIKEDMENVITE